MPSGRKPVHTENERMGRKQSPEAQVLRARVGGREREPRVGWKGFLGRQNQSGPWEDEKDVA